MKRVSCYLKMRLLGAIESAPGSTVVARIRHVSDQAFFDEEGRRFQFAWRTIQTSCGYAASPADVATISVANCDVSPANRPNPFPEALCGLAARNNPTELCAADSKPQTRVFVCAGSIAYAVLATLSKVASA